MFTTPSCIVIDDEQSWLDAIAVYLKGLDSPLHVKGFLKPRDALEHLGRNRAGIVLCDISMPLLDGLTLARTIRQIDFGVPIILIDDAEQQPAELLPAGATAYIKKRSLFIELVPVVSKLLRPAGGFPSIKTRSPNDYRSEKLN